MIQDNAGRRASSTVSKEDRVFDLMVVSFENAASHKYVVQKGKSLSRASSASSFLVLIQKSHKVCFENRSSKPLSLDKSANSSWAFNDRCVTKAYKWSHELSFPDVPRKVLSKVCVKAIHAYALTIKRLDKCFSDP